ncbi:MAG: DUF3617 family protein, partial [Burkholderiaceae bacterium]|nr:DUF3617 family protein [Burkholderiaceae bacterium]
MPVRCLTPVALLAALLSAAAGPALAQNQKLRPGLWENRISLKTQGGQFEAAMAQLQQSLASLPPAQRKALEQQMQQQGLGLAGKETVAPSCITPQQADLDSLPQDPACTQTVQRQGLNTLLVTFSCKGSGSTPPSTGG